MLRKIWETCGDVTTNFWLFLFISLNLAIGSYYTKIFPALFGPLNQLLLQDWLREHGQYQGDKIWWLVTLLILLFFLGVNTLVCAVNRFLALWPRRKQTGIRIFSIKIAPSLIHLCFLTILLGHFLSLISGFNRVVPVKLGMSESLPGKASLEMINQVTDRYLTPPALRHSIKQCTVTLRLFTPERETIREIRLLEPVFWQGFNLHLDMAKRAGAKPDLKLIIKKDPGLKFIFLGFAVLIALLLWYVPQRKKS